MLLGSDDVQTDLDGNACFRIFLTTAYCGAPPGPRGRAIAPCPLHAAARRTFGKRTGPNAELGERGASKRALPRTGLLGPRYGGEPQKYGNPRANTLIACANSRSLLQVLLLYCCIWWVGGLVGRLCVGVITITIHMYSSTEQLIKNRVAVGWI